MSIKLYYALPSPPCRATLLTIKALQLEVDLVPINLVAQEHLTTDFLKINPFHTLPTIQDEEFYIWDSHAINCYLVDKFGEDDGLYPRDLQRRAVVDQRLHFDSNVLSARFAAIVSPILREGARIIPKDKSDALLQGLTLLESLLEKSYYVTGNTLTIADFSLVATVSSANAVLPLASNRFPNIFEWLARMESLPYYQEANQEGLDAFATMLKSKHLVRQASAVK
ncbi:glutathione S-transferase 1-like [Zophobas morio]|uniref:glutathione S-transferase 1-like n=1 Tax=Zophobas morio TaxID=2755281 RepID=UPI003082AF6A